MPSVQSVRICVCAAREEAGAVRARRDADLDRDRPDLLGAAAVGAALVDRDLLADEVLVDRVGRLLDARLRERVLDRSASPSGRPGTAAATPSTMRSKRMPRLRGLELLRVLLGVGQLAQLALELLAHRALDGHEALLVEDQGEALP